MLGALLGGGGGLSASSSASASQETANNISSGTITVGGLNMGPPKPLIDNSVLMIGGLVLVGGLALMLSKK